MPEFVEKVKDPSDLTKFEEKAQRNNLPQVLLFSSKPNTSPLTKYLSVEFRRRLLLAEIKPNKKNEPILEKYGVTKLPALIVIPPSAEGGGNPIPVVYEGDGFTRNKLSSFLSKHALKDPVLAAKKKEESPKKEEATQESQQKTADEAQGSEPPKQKVASSEL